MVSCVPIFATGDALCPLELWQAVARRSPHVRADGSAPLALPAFHTADGAPLQHKFMTRRTLQLMRAAGISLVDDRGQTLSVMASSWRAGGGCDPRWRLVSAKQRSWSWAAGTRRRGPITFFFLGTTFVEQARGCGSTQAVRQATRPIRLPCGWVQRMSGLDRNSCAMMKPRRLEWCRRPRLLCPDGARRRSARPRARPGSVWG